MRAYFRLAPNFGVSMPWWLVPFALVCWVTAALVYWLVMLAVLAVLVLARAGARGWAGWQARHPSA